MRRRGGRRRTPVVLAVSALLAAGAGAFTGLHTWVVSPDAAVAQTLPAPAPTTPAPTTASPTVSGPTEQSQLALVSLVLTQSAQARARIGPEVQDVVNCQASTADGARIMSQAIRQRQRALSHARQVNSSAIPGGAHLLGSLERLLQLSIRADRQYRSWMRNAPAGACPSPRAATYLAAYRTSIRATHEKRRFARLWSQLGQPAVDPDSI